LTNSLNQAIVPTEMKTSLLRPVYKKGNHKEIENYRHIAILPTISKISDIYFAELLDNFLDMKKVIIKEQYGYRRNQGAPDLLEQFCDTVNGALNNHLHVLVCFVDFSKAFDSINHTKLLDVLDDMGIRGSVMEWLRNYLNGRKCTVKVANHFSKKKGNEKSCTTRECPGT